MSLPSRRAAAYPATPLQSTDARRSTERGFGLVEIIVVLVIIAILMAVAVSSFRGSKRTTHFKAAQSAALLYSNAIEAYMADNGQTAPGFGVDGQWPQPKRGPVDTMVRNADNSAKTYLKSTPDAISSGLVTLGNESPSVAPSAIASAAHITYRRFGESGSNYFLLVQAKQVGDETSLRCVITNAVDDADGLPAGVKRC